MVKPRTTCLDDAELAAFVEGRMADGDALDDARAHVDSCDECQQLVAAYTGAFGQTNKRRGSDKRNESKEPERYRLIKVIGTGAMGIVHHAHDSSLDRDVALKVLRRGLGIEEERLVREARAMAKLRHPNAVTVFDAGRLPSDGTAFIAMELVKGETLRAWLSPPPETETTRTYPQILRVFAQCARALAAAHALDIVHRDFKPENVLVVTTKDPNGRVDIQAKVLDFGLSHSRGGGGAGGGGGGSPTEATPPTGADDAKLTAHGTLVGTPAYMAPEQHDGREADSRADQFAFFVTLFEALAKTRPFAGETRNQVRESIKKGVKGAALPEALPDKLRALILKGLAEKPTRRHASMDEVAAALEDLATPAKRPIAAFVAMGLAALLIGGVVFLNSQHGDTAFAGVPNVKLTPECRALGLSLARGISKEEETGVHDAFALTKDPNATAAEDHFIGMIRERLVTIELARGETCSGGELTRGDVECLQLLHDDAHDVLKYARKVFDHAGLEGAIVAARSLEAPAVCKGVLPDPVKPAPSSAAMDAAIHDEGIARMLFELPLEVAPVVASSVDGPPSKRTVLSQLRVLRVRVKEPAAFPDEGSWDDLERALEGLPSLFEQQRDEKHRAVDIAAQKRLGDAGGGGGGAAAGSNVPPVVPVPSKKRDVVLGLATRAAAGAETLRMETSRAEILLLRSEATGEEPGEELIALVGRAANANPRVSIGLDLFQSRLAAAADKGQVRRVQTLEAALASDLAGTVVVADALVARNELSRDQTRTEIDATISTSEATWGLWHSRMAFAHVQAAEWCETRGLKPLAIEHAKKAAEILRVSVTSPSRKTGVSSVYLARAIAILALYESDADAREALFTEADALAKGLYAGVIRARPLIIKARLELEQKDTRAAIRDANAAELGAGAWAIVPRAEARALAAEAMLMAGDRDRGAAAGPVFARALDSALLLAPRDRARLRLAAAKRIVTLGAPKNAADINLARDLARQAANEAVDPSDAQTFLQSLPP